LWLLLLLLLWPLQLRPLLLLLRPLLLWLLWLVLPCHNTRFRQGARLQEPNA